jgi:hypothetical protein
MDNPFGDTLMVKVNYFLAKHEVFCCRDVHFRLEVSIVDKFPPKAIISIQACRRVASTSDRAKPTFCPYQCFGRSSEFYALPAKYLLVLELADDPNFFLRFPA